MGEVEILSIIRHHLPIVFESQPFTEFIFVKAVGDALVTPDVFEWVVTLLDKKLIFFFFVSLLRC